MEIDVLIHARFCPACGDGWNEPREPAHEEVDDFEVVGATWYHPDGSWTWLECDPDSIAGLWLAQFLDRHWGMEAQAEACSLAGNLFEPPE